MSMHRDLDIMKIDAALSSPVITMEARVLLIIKKLALNTYGCSYGAGQ